MPPPTSRAPPPGKNLARSFRQSPSFPEGEEGREGEGRKNPQHTVTKWTMDTYAKKDRIFKGKGREVKCGTSFLC